MSFFELAAFYMVIICTGINSFFKQSINQQSWEIFCTLSQLSLSLHGRLGFLATMQAE